MRKLFLKNHLHYIYINPPPFCVKGGSSEATYFIFTLCSDSVSPQACYLERNEVDLCYLESAQCRTRSTQNASSFLSLEKLNVMGAAALVFQSALFKLFQNYLNQHNNSKY